MDESNAKRNAFPRQSVNDDMRRAAANLATIIRECGVSQSELSRRSGLSRQLINGWARQRLPVSLSTTVGLFLSGIQLNLADLLLDEQSLYNKLGKTPHSASELPQLLPRLAEFSKSEEGRKRRKAMDGSFRYRIRFKEAPIFVLEQTLQFESNSDETIVRAFDGPHVSNRLFGQGVCFSYPSIFFIFLELTEPPHQPLIYAYRDPLALKIMSLRGVVISPVSFGADFGRPLTGLTYLHRINADGSAVSENGFDPDREFNTFIPADGRSVLTV
jgi:transcriptional regulator with XRE-family HTH domain